MTKRKFPEEGKCRTCRCPCTGPITDLFQDSFKGQTYGDILRNKLSVELPNITGASCTICMRCTKLLESVDVFVRQCRQTNAGLVCTQTSSLEQNTKIEIDQTVVPEKDTSEKTCYLEMDCDEDEEISNDDETSDEPPAPYPEQPAINDGLVIKLEMVQPADTVESADEEASDDQEEKFVLFTSKISAPKGSRGQRGRGPAWKDDDLKELLQVAKRFRLSNEKIDNTAIYLALRNHPDLSRLSRDAIKAKLHSVKRALKKPGMPNIKNRIYERDALELFGGEV